LVEEPGFFGADRTVTDLITARKPNNPPSLSAFEKTPPILANDSATGRSDIPLFAVCRKDRKRCAQLSVQIERPVSNLQIGAAAP